MYPKSVYMDTLTIRNKLIGDTTANLVNIISNNVKFEPSLLSLSGENFAYRIPNKKESRSECKRVLNRWAKGIF